MAQRFRNLYNGIVEVIDEYRPQVMAVEQLYAHYEHPRTAILMGHARGVMLLAAAAARHARDQLQRHADQEDDHRPRPGEQGADAARHAAANWACRRCPSRPTWPTPWPSALCHTT